MAGHPADFDEWLSGEGFASNPPAWRVVRSRTGVEVRPHHGTMIAGLSFAAVFFAGGGSFFVWNGLRSGGLAAVGVLAGAGLIVGAGLFVLIAVATARDRRAGPYLTHSTYFVRGGTISLPRERLTFPATDAREWRVVTGSRVGPPGRQKQWTGDHSELHLIVRTPAGETAYPVVRWTGTPSAGLRPADLLRELADATRLPLRFVEQRQGTAVPPPQDTMRELLDRPT
ncbi:MAG: hypothetical protein JWO31_1656 [Phycisphaerales bacterium]|nr:hypothetical protein [Phycisphaerales bacterium]